jgi:hypothetical protein
LKAAYEKAIGHRTSNSTIYSLLARHGWRKLMPRQLDRHLLGSRYLDVGRNH